MAADVGELAEAMGFDRYATLGHSYGAFVVLQQAVDRPGHAAATVVSSGAPSARFLAAVEDNLAAFEPVELREQVTQSWAREQEVQTAEECDTLLHDQMPFHFADPRDPRIEEFERRTAGIVQSPDLLRHFAVADYGAIEVEDRLGDIAQPVLVLSGRHDRTCVVEAGEAIAAGIGDAELVVFENSGHMTYVEQNEEYLAAVRGFLQSVP
jgi:pimeloyl-ACP methyl ester carboxylesterase